MYYLYYCVCENVSCLITPSFSLSFRFVPFSSKHRWCFESLSMLPACSSPHREHDLSCVQACSCHVHIRCPGTTMAITTTRPGWIILLIIMLYYTIYTSSTLHSTPKYLSLPRIQFICRIAVSVINVLCNLGGGATLAPWHCFTLLK